jgi:hypothetical protein
MKINALLHLWIIYGLRSSSKSVICIMCGFQDVEACIDLGELKFEGSHY